MAFKPVGEPDLARKHLIWEQGFATQFLVVASLITAGYFALRNNHHVIIFAQEYYDTAQWRLMQAAESMSLWFVMGMLSSSCCLIQILLNTLSFGCAGLNKVFGPLRPMFLAITACLQVYSWWLVIKNRWAMTGAAVSTLVVLAISFLPEALDCWNRWAHQRQVAKRKGSARTVATLQVEGLGCVSCEKTVLDTVAASPSVVQSQMVFEQKALTLWLAEGTPDAPRICAGIQKSLLSAGFETEVVGIAPNSSTQSQCMKHTKAA